MPWPEWLDKAEQLAKKDLTCPDCFVTVDDQTVFARFKGDGCDHSDPVCAVCEKPLSHIAPWAVFSGTFAYFCCSVECAVKL